jgi:hypothetical protein
MDQIYSAGASTRSLEHPVNDLEEKIDDLFKNRLQTVGVKCRWKEKRKKLEKS